MQQVAPRTFPVSFEYVGQTAGSKDVEVRARITGIIEKRLYQEGSFVKAGQPLFTIDAAAIAGAGRRGERRACARGRAEGASRPGSSRA